MFACCAPKVWYRVFASSAVFSVSVDIIQVLGVELTVETAKSVISLDLGAREAPNASNSDSM